jgi:Amt family ammonium transporter
MRSKGEDAMKKFLSIIALASALGFGVFGINSLSYAEDPAPAATEAAPAATPAAAEAAPAAPAATDAAAATPAPVPI